MRTITLETTAADLDHLHLSADGHGVFGKTSKAALNRMLRDHHKLIAFHRGELALLEELERGDR